MSPRTNYLSNTLDDAASVFEIPDLGGGLDSETNPRKLGPNFSPDCENVKFTSDGRLIGRDGYVQRIAPVAGNHADGLASFWDTTGALHRLEWINGNLYEITSGARVLVSAASYTAGNRIAWVDLNYKLYWSDGVTLGPANVGMRVFDPIAVTDGWQASSGAPGSVQPPACKSLTAYAGSLVAGNCIVSGVAQRTNIYWCNVLDPSTWLAANTFAVAPGSGGEINAVVPMSLSTVAIEPQSVLFIGKNRANVFQLKGALSSGSLAEAIVNIAAGCLDGASCKFVAGPDGSGMVFFLGTDRVVYGTNGSAVVKVSKPIRRELRKQVNDTISGGTPYIFSAVRVEADSMYALNVGSGVYYLFDWDLQHWTRYRNWPQGNLIETYDNTGLPVVYCADWSTRQVAELNNGSTDNGAPIAAYWKSALLDFGDPASQKIFQELYIDFATDFGAVDIQVAPNQGYDPPATGTVQGDSLGSSNVLIWNVGQWGINVWGPGDTVNYQGRKGHIKLGVSITGVAGKGKCQGYDCQIKLTNNTVANGHFEVLGLQVTFVRDGRKRVTNT